jgi:hypothetical protein
MPGFWCDWETDGRKLFWNGSEKSYGMDKWLVLLIDKFFKPHGHVLNGRIFAQGENPGDTWIIDVQNNVVNVIKLLDMKALGITE